MKTLMMVVGTKLAAFMGLKTIGAFLLAEKALLMGKIALMLTGMMFYNKFMFSKKGASNGSIVKQNDWNDSLLGSYGAGNGGNTGSSNSGAGSSSWSASYDRRVFDS